MKEYTIVEVKKARSDQGNCLACGNEIKAGDAFKRLSAPNPDKVFFCANCPVDQNLIGKNRHGTQNGKVNEALATKTSGDTKQVRQIASFITEEKPNHVKVYTETEEEKESEDSDVLAKSCLEIPKAYCSKCHRSHEIGSRRYERHLAFIKKFDRF